MRLFGVVTTAGAPEWFTRCYVGNPSRKVLMRGLARLMVARRAERIWLALYGMEKVCALSRAAFIQRVRQRFGRIKP
jgi:hypothetical protein